ncbi:hypothetical protein DFAR_200033 [Desulfarculales bacterium]
MDPVRGHAFLSPLATADSLREICQGLSCCLDKLSHLGGSAAPKRSTLSYAKQHKPSSCSEPCSSKPWSVSVPKALWAGKRVRSNSRTSSWAWAPPPSPCT